MTELVETGVSGLDTLLMGGIPEGSCILLIAPPMAEVRLFCLEFLFRGLEKKEPGMMVTLNSPPERLKSSGEKYGFQFEKEEKKGIFKWIDGYSIHANKESEGKEGIRVVGGPLALTDTSIALTEIQAKFRSNAPHYRFIFDSISTLLIYNTPETVYRFIEVAVAKIRSSGGVGFFLLGEGMHDEKIEMLIRHRMDGTIKIDEKLNIEALNLPVPGKPVKGKLKLGEKSFRIIFDKDKRKELVEINAREVLKIIEEGGLSEETLEEILKKERKKKRAEQVMETIMKKLEDEK